MKLPLEWLKSYTDIKSVSPREFAHRMTMSGSKVEGYVCESDAIHNVVAGKVVTKKRHPDSDHMWICSVFVGEKLVQIVTGAQNVNEGALVPVALDGARLPNGQTITSGVLRGEKSEGMMCSLAELGLSAHDFPDCIEDGIMILPFETKPGTDVAEVVGLNDTIFDFEITSNRPDCLGITGLAREAAITFGAPLTLPAPSLKNTRGDVKKLLSVTNQTPKNCLRYTGAVVENVRIAPSPLWMRERLRRCGVRPINNIVDITNYVMLEYNQPMHAFDARFVEGGGIVIRQAEKGEYLTTLDGTARALTPDMMVIADGKKALAVAGVMGGEYSSIVDDTTTLIFESACFNGVNVRTTARALGMRTEASARFEKGLDPHATEAALLRALELVQQLDAGDVVAGLVDARGDMPQPQPIVLEPARVRAFLGAEIIDAFMIETLQKLGCTMGLGGTVTPPTYRADMEGFADLCEEVARFYGYDNLPSTVMSGVAAARPTERQRFERAVIADCVAAGFFEINTLSFMGNHDLDLLELLGNSPLRTAVCISNPLGEESGMMRTTALAGMLQVLARNSAARLDSARLFELTRVFLPTKETLPDERAVLTLGCYGNGDYYTIKGVLEALCRRAGLRDIEFERLSDDPSLHPGRAATLTCGGRVLARLGEVLPAVCENFGIHARACVAELDLDALYALRDLTVKFTQLPKYPAITRDIALVCDLDVPSAAIEKAIREGCGEILEDVHVFDVYTGDKMAQGKKSIAYSLLLRDRTRTLTDEQADGAITRALSLLRALGIELRS